VIPWYVNCQVTSFRRTADPLGSIDNFSWRVLLPHLGKHVQDSFLASLPSHPIQYTSMLHSYFNPLSECGKCFGLLQQDAWPDHIVAEIVHEDDEGHGHSLARSAPNTCRYLWNYLNDGDHRATTKIGTCIGQERFDFFADLLGDVIGDRETSGLVGGTGHLE